MTATTATKAPASAANTFGSLNQIEAGVLNVGYAAAVPARGPVVILLHGGPRHPHLRGRCTFAGRRRPPGDRAVPTRLRDDAFPGEPNAPQRSAVGSRRRHGRPDGRTRDGASDRRRLRLGARTACIVAALWPERCKALVSVSGYLIGNQEVGKVPLPPEAELQWWYQYYFATDRCRAGYDKYRREFAKLIWRTASPKWKFDDATFDRSAASFDNPDHVAIAIHNYRWRLGWAMASRATTIWRSGSPKLQR